MTEQGGRAESGAAGQTADIDFSVPSVARVYDAMLGGYFAKT